MRKGFLLLLILMLLLVGCNTTTEQPNPHDLSKLNTTNQMIEGMRLVWKTPSDYPIEKIEFKPTQYTAKVPPYSIAPDFSNIKNFSRFQGFTKGQLEKLKNNGFVVVETGPDNAFMKMYDIYEQNEYRQIPQFITVDMALHLYHKFFDETLKKIEKEHLVDALKQLTENMLQKTLTLYRSDTSRGVKEELSQIAVYFSVANKLINDSYGDLPAALMPIAEEEIKNLENSKSAGYKHSPLFGYDVNYEQFIVRGHYKGDEALERYFKTMIWYGLLGYPFGDQKSGFNTEAVTKALLITYIANLERNGVNDIALWDQIYSPTLFFVGQSDDITLFQLKEVIQRVYGPNVTPADLKDKAYHKKLKEEIDQLPPPQIGLKLVTGAVDTPTGKQFRFMGQRYTLDAKIMQELMVPIQRPIPTGLDVAAAFGNKRAETLAKEGYLMNLEPAKYDMNLRLMKEKVRSLTLSDWQQNLYNGWLWALASVWTEQDDPKNLPFFMQNEAWVDKNIQTGLGSYAELKHDTILYAKQPAAEMGGGEEIAAYLPNYVEPAVEVYDRLIWLVHFSKVNLANRGLLSDNMKATLDELEKVYTLFRDISVKELENRPITEEENNALRRIGGTLEWIDDNLSQDYNQALSSAVISDIAGIADVGWFLEIGTGFPNEIWVVISRDGKEYLARGAVYSYYEFVSQKPLTDQEWHERLGIERKKDGEWEYEQINPTQLLKKAPKQPDWIGSFKSFDANRIKTTPVEYRIE